MIGDRPFNRRLILTIGAAILLAGPGRAQPTRTRVIGMLAPGSAASAASAANLNAFRQGLRGLGYGESDIAIESRFAESHAERLPDLAAELEAIVTAGTAAAQMAKQATASIPIVMAASANPVGLGLVASLVRPGGNVTGISNDREETVGKRLQLLKTVVPCARRIAILFNPTNPLWAAGWPMLEALTSALGLELVRGPVRVPDELESAFSTIEKEQADAIMVAIDAIFVDEPGRVAALVARARLPAIYGARVHAAAGGLMSYGPDFREGFRLAATYVDKILNGAKLADLPVQQPTRFELVVNLETAKALGLTIPPSILARADEVIE
jgi:putative ABC transport system substrate-binding protein